MEITRRIYIDIDPKLLKEKNYVIAAKCMLDNYYSYNNETKERTITKYLFKKKLREDLGLKRRKIDSIIEVFERSAVVEFIDEKTYLITKPHHYALLEPWTAQFCIENLDDLGFKVYCFLLGKMETYRDLHLLKPYKFSNSGEKGLLTICGYSNTGANNKRMNEQLKILGDTRLIDFTDPIPIRDKKGKWCGWYRELLDVRDYFDTLEW